MKRILTAVLCAVFILNLSVFAKTPDTSKLITYPAPGGVEMNDEFLLEVRTDGAEWRKVDLYNVKVSDGLIIDGDETHQKDASIGYFDFTGTVSLKVTYNRGDVQSFRIRPDAKNVEYTRDGNSIEFSIDKPEKLLVEVDNKSKTQLHIFANAIEDYGVDKNANNVMYFGAGLHSQENDTRIKRYWTDGYKDGWYDIVVVPSDTVVYIDGGAVVKAGFIFADEWLKSPYIVTKGANNSKIVGHGIINLRDSNTYDGVQTGRKVRKDFVVFNTITTLFSNNITIDGPISVNSGEQGAATRWSNNVVINNYKLFDCMQWGDGLQFYGCSDVEISDCFVRSSDDCISIYSNRITGPHGMDVANFEVSDNILYADAAHTIYIGCHGSKDPENRLKIENLNFRRNYLLEASASSSYHGMMAIGCGDENIVKDILFEDMEVEDFSNSSLFYVKTIKGGYNPAPGYIVENVTFRNINYNGSNKNASPIGGYDESRPVKNITFENVTINGKPIVDPDDGNIKILGNTENIKFMHKDVEGVFYAEAEEAQAAADITLEEADTVIPKVSGMTIDADPSDWEGAETETIKIPEMGNNSVSAALYNGADDLSAELKLAYDDENLYFWIDVTDDIHYMQKGSEYWTGDSVQIAVNNGGKYGPEFGFSTEGVVYKNGSFVYDEKLKPEDIEFVAKRSGKHTIYEIRMPWEAALEKMPNGGLALSVLINENDEAGREGWIEWGKGIGDGKSVTDFKKAAFGVTCAFEDIKGHWCEDNIVSLFKSGIVKGKSDTEFEPESGITRAEFLALLMRSAGLKGNKYAGAFSDVGADDWFARLAQAAKNKKFFADEMTEDGRMQPEKPITREEAAYAATAILEYKNITLDTKEDNFADSSAVSDWAAENVEKAAGAGIIEGENGSFRPGDGLTRAEACTIIKRFSDKLK